MAPPTLAPLRATAACLPLLLLAGCPTDDRSLRYGSVMNDSSTGHPEAGADGVGLGGDASGGEPSTGNDAGAGAVAGVSGSVGGTETTGGVPATNGGSPNTNGGSMQAGSSGSPTSGSASGGSSGGTEGGGNGGSGGGTAGSGSIDTGPCGDLDQNTVQDCDETLAQNARFDATIDSWLADPTLTQTWKATDARGTAMSGSLGLLFQTSGSSSGWSMAGTGQCLVAWSMMSYEVGARARLPQGQAGGRATITLLYYGNDGCQGTLLKSETPAFMAEVGTWQAVHVTRKMPPGTRSVLLRLGASMPTGQSSIEVEFDDILFREN